MKTTQKGNEKQIIKRLEYHIISSRKKWLIKKAGNKTATKVFASKQEAIQYAYELPPHSKIVIHYTDGCVEKVLD